MSIGMGTGLYYPGPFEPAKHMPMIRDAGYDAIELNIFKGPQHFNWRDAAMVDAVRNTCDRTGLTVWSIHSPDVGQLGSPEAPVRQVQIDALLESFDLADQLGAQHVVSHGLIKGDFINDKAGTVGRMIESVEQLLPRVRDSGAQLAFENDNYRPGLPWRAVEVLDVVRQFNEPKQIGYVLDTGHANIGGELAEICDALDSELITTHLNDNDGKGDQHKAPGDGTVDWSGVWSMLRRTGYEGCFMYEVEDIGGTRTHSELLDQTMAHHRRMYGG